MTRGRDHLLGLCGFLDISTSEWHTPLTYLPITQPFSTVSLTPGLAIQGHTEHRLRKGPWSSEPGFQGSRLLYYECRVDSPPVLKLFLSLLQAFFTFSFFSLRDARKD